MIFRMRAPAYGWGVSRLRCLPGRWTAAHPARRFMRSFGKDWDADVIDYYARRCAGNRAELAKTQELLLAAAQAGDNSAAALYRKAAGHLCETAAAVYRKLCFQEPVHISYSGGVFQVRDFLLQPFLRQVRQAIPGCVANSPLYTPEEGAALAAARLLEKEA